MLTAIGTYTILRAINLWDPLTTEEALSNFSIWSLVFFLPFFLLVLTLRGYFIIAEKYDMPALAWSTRSFIYAIIAMSIIIVLAILLQVSQAHEAAQRVSYALINLVAIPYTLAPLAIAIAVYPLRRKFGLVSLYPLIVWLTILVYYAYLIIFTGILGFDPPAFLGMMVWMPIPEALFVIASIFVFRAAAGETKRR